MLAVNTYCRLTWPIAHTALARNASDGKNSSRVFPVVNCDFAFIVINFSSLSFSIILVSSLPSRSSSRTNTSHFATATVRHFFSIIPKLNTVINKSLQCILPVLTWPTGTGRLKMQDVKMADQQNSCHAFSRPAFSAPQKNWYYLHHFWTFLIFLFLVVIFLHCGTIRAHRVIVRESYFCAEFVLRLLCVVDALIQTVIYTYCRFAAA